MIPLLHAESIRTALRDDQLLATYLHVRAPLRLVGDDWTSPLGWTPAWFRPYVHQAAAFERLTTSRSFSQSTVLVGARGSGRTEAYLFPVLDHSLRQHKNARPGLKALIVCPTVGVAREHAMRAATVLAWDPALRGVTIGCHVTGLEPEDSDASGTATPPIAVGEISVAVDSTTLGATPPDVLFTTPNHLESLMFDPALRGLWRATTRESLRYIVVEDLQSHDDGSISELAMALRRVGAKLHMKSTSLGSPLGGATLVATVTTSDTAPTIEPEFIDGVAGLASQVFGVELGVDAVVVEDRHTASELSAAVDRAARTPTPAELAAVDQDDVAAIARAFGLADVAGDPNQLGSRLGVHPLTAAVMAAASERPTELDRVLDVIGQWVPGWQPDSSQADAAAADSRTAVQALARFLRLLSTARRQVGGAELPLVTQEVHVWLHRGAGRSGPEVASDVLAAFWGSGQLDERDRRTLVLTDSPHVASHGAASLRRTLSQPPDAAAPGVIARDVTPVTPPGQRSAIEVAFSSAHPEAPLALLATPGPDLGVDAGGLATTILLGAPLTVGAYRARIGALGRDGGTSLVVTIVGDSVHDAAAVTALDRIVSGPIGLPTCRVDDVELRRFFLAEVIDHLISTEQLRISATAPMEVAVRSAFQPETPLRRLVDAAADDDLVSSFIASLGVAAFGSHPGEEPSGAAHPGVPGMLFGRPITTGTGSGALSVAQGPAAGDDADRGSGGVPRPDGVLAPLPPLGSSMRLGASEAPAVTIFEADERIEELRAFAAHGVEPMLRDAVERWRASMLVLRGRHRRVAAMLRASAGPGADPVEVDQLRREAAVVVGEVRQRRLQPWTDVLADVGLLASSHALGTNGADVVELRAALWSASPDAPSVRFRLRASEVSEISVAAFAPGSVMDLEAHRILVDGVELDGRGNGAYEVRVRCERCGWSTPASAAAAQAGSCQGCAVPLADTSKRRVLRLRTVVAEGPEEAARDAGSDIPAPNAAVVELESTSTAAAWCLTSIPFGAQLIEGARLRSWVGSGAVCRHCGVARGVRRAPGERPAWVHRLWCAARTDPAHEVWDAVELLDEQTVDAVRILVPVSRIDAERRVAGFEAAIVGGLAQLGHLVDGLMTTRTSTVDAAGTVRHFVVVHAAASGGGQDSSGAWTGTAGVLRRLADPAYLREVLAAATTSGSSSELSRGTVGRILNDVVAHGGAPAAVDSLDSVDLGAIERRELRDAFLDTLVLWAQRDHHAEIRRAADASSGDVFEVSITLDARRHDYRVRTTPPDAATGEVLALDGIAPDVWIAPSSAGGPTFAIVLDRTEDQRKVRQASPSAADRPICWHLSRADVEAFFAALGSPGELDVPGVVLFDDTTRAAIDAAQQSRGGAFSASALEQNPVALLLDVLARPSFGEWHRLATAASSAVGDASDGPTPMAVADRSAWRNVEKLAEILPPG